MLWLLQTTLIWLLTPRGANFLFAMLCLLAAAGANGRIVAALSAMLYLWLTFL